MMHEVSRQSHSLRQMAQGLSDKARSRTPARRSPWIAVTGAKGGVGKTMLAVNLAIMIAQRGQRTLLVDLDPGCGNVNVHLRVSPRWFLDDVVDGQCTLQDAMDLGPCGLNLLSTRSGSLTLNDPSGIEAALDAIAHLAGGFDVVIFDTGAGIGPAVLTVAERADLVLGTSTPEPSALTDAYALCKQLHLRNRPLPKLLVNRAHTQNVAMKTASRLQTVCRRFLGQDCELFAWVRADQALELSVIEQRPFALHGQGPVAQDLQGLCAATLSALPPMPQRPAITHRPIGLETGHSSGVG